MSQQTHRTRTVSTADAIMFKLQIFKLMTKQTVITALRSLAV